MKIEEVRPSFTVYLIASEQERLGGLADALGLAGYMVASFTELTAAFSELVSNPPHFILFDFEESKFNIKKAVKQINLQLPETHVFLVTPLAQREAAAAFLETGVSDIILTPLASPLELVRALDRSAERDYFMYMNERLAASSEGELVSERIEETRAGEPMPAPDDGAGDVHLEYARNLFERKSADECISVFIACVSNALGAAPAVHFKYIANRRVLVASQGHLTDGVDLGGLGLNFNEISSSFRTSHLRDPMGLKELSHLVGEVFQTDGFFAVPIEAFGDVLGVTVFLRPEPAPAVLGMLRDWMMLLNRALSLIEAEKRLHVMCVKDPSTDLYTRRSVARVGRTCRFPWR